MSDISKDLCFKASNELIKENNKFQTINKSKKLTVVNNYRVKDISISVNSDAFANKISNSQFSPKTLFEASPLFNLKSNCQLKSKNSTIISSIFNSRIITGKEKDMNTNIQDYSNYFDARSNQEKIMKLFSKLSLNLEKTEITLKQQEKNALIRKQWTLLAKIADRLLLYFFINEK